LIRAARMLQLLELLDGRFGRSRDDLAVALAVSERTIYRDLAELEGWGFPIVCQDGHYRLTAASSALRPVLFTAGEKSMLRYLLGVRSFEKHPELARRIHSLRAKLAAPLENGGESGVAADLDRSGPVVPEVMTALEEAIERQQTILAEYVSLSSGARRRKIDPWVMFHRAEAWYLAGRCHENDGPRMFRLDRIRSVRVTSDYFLRSKDFDVEGWLANAWTLYHGDEAFEVVIWFDASLAPLIENARHHEGEATRRLEDGRVEYRVTVSHVEEIARWIAGFGGGAVAVEPEALVTRVREIAEGVGRAHALRGPVRRLAAKTMAKRRT